MQALLISHLPALQVVLPLVAAPFCALSMRGGLAWAIALAASLAALAASLSSRVQNSRSLR